MSFRFIHTSDWHLGKRAQFVPGDAGAAVRDARLRAVRRLGALAREQRAELIIVAGDVLENHALKPDTVRKLFDAIQEIEIPVYLLPGNHDPFNAAAFYRSELWERECPPNLRLMTSRDPILVREDVVLFPCPHLDRFSFGDSTEHLNSSFGPRGLMRIGVAHGGIREIVAGFGDAGASSSAIPIDRAERGALDYLALGDWHGTFEVGPRTWYSGTPEPTRFVERDPGNVLLVEVERLGAVPRVEKHPVAELRWSKQALSLSGPSDLGVMERLIEDMESKECTLLELELEGAIDLETRERLDGALARARPVPLCAGHRQSPHHRVRGGLRSARLGGMARRSLGLPTS